ncbi:MAG: acyl-CoA dehydrogenase family protein [Coleofasciculaceae cyanobacterium]
MASIIKNQDNINHIEDDTVSTLLNLTESYLREFVAPVAYQIDQDSQALKKVLQGMGDRSLLGLRIPQTWSGVDITEITYRRFQQLIPRYSGALAFLQTQHQSAAEFISHSQNKSLQQQYLPQMGSGKILVGVGFSHLRKNDNSLLKAFPKNGGFQLNGQVPWLTGFNLFSQCIVAASLPDGQAVYGIIPFNEIKQNMGATITLSKPMQLGAMASTNTVSAAINNWFLAEENVVSIKPAGAIQESDQKNVLNHGFTCLGCAEAALDIVETTAHTKQLLFINKAFDSLADELVRCQKAMLEALSPNTKSWQERLQLRAWAINLMLRCANAAVIVSSGAANYQNHPAQRVYREALVFAVSGQTTAVMEATLTKLVD